METALFHASPPHQQQHQCQEKAGTSRRTHASKTFRLSQTVPTHDVGCRTCASRALLPRYALARKLPPMTGYRTATGSTWRRLAASLLPGVGMLLASTASADRITPIEVTLPGPSAVRVRVSRGSSDSSDDRSLIAGKFEPGQVVKASTPDDCVCVQQTYEPFTDVDWAAGSSICRPQRCTWAGRSKHCVPAPDHTIRIAIRSKR